MDANYELHSHRLELQTRALAHGQQIQRSSKLANSALAPASEVGCVIRLNSVKFNLTPRSVSPVPRSIDRENVFELQAFVHLARHAAVRQPALVHESVELLCGIFRLREKVVESLDVVGRASVKDATGIDIKGNCIEVLLVSANKALWSPRAVRLTAGRLETIQLIAFLHCVFDPPCGAGLVAAWWCHNNTVLGCSPPLCAGSANRPVSTTPFYGSGILTLIHRHYIYPSLPPVTRTHLA